MSQPLDLNIHRFNPLTLGARTVYHVPSLSEENQQGFQVGLFAELQRLPDALFCGAVDNEYMIRNRLDDQVRRGEITRQQADTLFQDFEAKQPIRMPVEYMNGDIFPINWATKLEALQQAVGFQMYGIQILNQSGSDYSVGCHIWPLVLEQPYPAWGGSLYQQIIAEAGRLLLNNTIVADDNSVRVRVDVVDPLPVTQLVNTSQKAQEIEAGVLAFMQAYPDVFIQTITRYGRDYTIYRRV